MFRDRMSEEELTLNGEQTDLKKYVEDVGGIHGLREVHKVREDGIIFSMGQVFPLKIHHLLSFQ